MLNAASFRLLVTAIAVLDGLALVGCVLLLALDRAVPDALWTIAATGFTAIPALYIHPPTPAARAGERSGR